MSLNLKSKFAALTCAALTLAGCGQKTIAEATTSVAASTPVARTFGHASFADGQIILELPESNLVAVRKTRFGAVLVDCTDRTVSNATVQVGTGSWLGEPTGSPVPFDQLNADTARRYSDLCSKLTAAKTAVPN